MGLALAGCPAEDDGDDSNGSGATTGDASSATGEPDPATVGGGEPDYGSPVTAGWGETSSGPSTAGSSTGDVSTGTGGESSSGSTSDATSGSSSTGIGEPEYGVPTTGE